MTPKFFLPMLVFGMIASISAPTSAAPVKAIGEALIQAPLILAQTPGMERRQDRRDARRDCRQQNGLVGADKRGCKQDRRQQR